MELASKLNALPELDQSNSNRGMTTFLDLDSDSSAPSSAQTSPREHATPLQPPPKRSLTTTARNSVTNSKDIYATNDKAATADTPLAMASPDIDMVPKVHDAVRTLLDLSSDSSTDALSPPGLVNSGSASDSEMQSSGSDGSRGSPDIFEQSNNSDTALAKEDGLDEEFVGPTPLQLQSEFPEVVNGDYVDEPDSACHQELESLLRSVSQSSKACVVRPSQGPFQAQLIALTCRTDDQLHGPQEGSRKDQAQPDKEISLPSGADVESCSVRINKVRTAMKEWGGEHVQPEVWIPLRSMPTVLGDDGQVRPDIDRLKIWLETLDAETENFVMSMQMIEPASRRQYREKFHQRKPVPSPTRLSSLLMSAAVDHQQSGDVPFDHTADLTKFSLSAIQQLFLRASLNTQKVTEESTPDNRFTQSILLQVHNDVDPTDISPSLDALVTRHGMLRARLKIDGDHLAQVIVPEAAGSYRFRHHHAARDEDIGRIMESSQAAIDVVTGPVFTADHIHAADGRELLYLAAHHLVVDVVSWRIIVHNLDELLRDGRLVADHSISFPDWINYQHYEANHRLVKPALPFDIAPIDLGYWGLEQRDNIYGDTERHMFTLDPDLTEALQSRCNRVFRTETADIFLTALLLSFHQVFSDRPAPTIWKQEFGRETNNRDYNIDETVGWFTTLCPITAAVDTTSDFIHLLKLMKDTRRAIPRHGIPYFNSEFTSAHTQLSGLPVEIMFNCVESIPQIHRSGGLLEPVTPPNHDMKSLISDIGADVGRTALFEVSAVMDSDGARVEAVVSPTKEQTRVEEWMTRFEAVMRDSIARLRNMDPQLTQADTPLIKTSYKGLSTLSSDSLSAFGIDSADEIETVLPINAMQQEILVAQSQDQDSYHVQSVYELDTTDGQKIDQARLCNAWSSLVCKHVALRSVFIDSISETGLFDQLILKKISPNMLFLDSPDPETALATLPAMKVSAGQPRHRLVVVRSSVRTLVCIDASQAILDSRSIANLVAQLGRIYMGQDVRVDTTLLTTYLYHITTDATNHVKTISRDLKGVKPCILPRLTLGEGFDLETQTFELEITRRKLDDFCKYQEITPNVVLQMAWALVLRIYVGMDQVTFGCELPGRDEDALPGISNAIGSFSAVFPCKVDLSPERTVRQCLRSLGLLSASVIGRADLTTSAVEHALGLKGKPMYNTCLSFQYPELESDDGHRGLRSSLWSSSSSMDCDLSLHCAFFGDKLHTAVSSRNVSGYQISNTIRSFEHAVRAIIESPMQAISDVDLFTDRDYAHLAVQGLQVSDEMFKVNECLHQRILSHARNRPNAMAVAALDGNMTYHQMSKFVSSLAVYLVNLGVRPGVVVPVVLEKSWWAPIILIGVMQAGAAFVCLDSQDAESFDATIKQLNPQLIIAGESAWGGLNSLTPNIVVVNNSFFSSLPPQLSITAQNPTPDHAACVLYSPATRARAPPRSIFYTHASLCSAFQVQGQAMKLNENSRVLQVSGFNNDIALTEILGTMFHGGCVCIPAPNERGPYLEKAIARMGVTWSYMTTVLARKVIPSKVPSLQTICFRTRRLDEDIRETWHDRADLLLAYGAPDVCPLGISVSETVGQNNMSVIPPPLAGKYWILNPDNPKKLMPLGAIGELAIDSPILTPHKYAPGGILLARDGHVLGVSDKPRPRSLRTGHKVRYLEDGTIEFLSSVRDEVFIGGQAVPTTDIENRLRKCLGRNVDIALEGITTSDNVQVLVAFVELREESLHGPNDFAKVDLPPEKHAALVKTLTEATRSGLLPMAQRIPLSHVPAVFVPIKTFPLSTSLKINRRKLQKMVSFMSYEQLQQMSAMPSPAELANGTLTEKPLPFTKVEEKMRAIWAKVLGISAVDINNHDNFQSLGGSREAAVQLVKECRDTEFPISVKDVVRGASLAQICQPFADLEEPGPLKNLVQDSKSQSVPRHRHTSKPQTTKVAGLPEIFVKEAIAPQLKEYRHNIADVAEASPHQIRSLEGNLFKIKAGLRWLVLNFNGPVRYQKLEAACIALSKLHPIIRTAFAVHERRVYQVRIESFRPEFSRRTCSLSDLANETQRIIDYDQATGYKLRDPITKFYFLDAVHQATLVVRLSTALVDDHSVSHFVNDLTALFKSTNTTSLKRWSFYDYVRTVKFSNYLEGLEFWKEHLEGAVMTQVVSHSKPPPPTDKVKTLKRTLKIDSLAEFGLSFDTVLKTAWGIMLATLSGSNDVLFGEVIHGQNISRPKNVDISSMIGPVTNTIPVRIRFPAVHTTPLDIMKTVQGQRMSSRPFEAIGGLELIQKCTNWAYWTRFSTVVQHRPQALVDGLTTLNMGNTTFTYTLAKPDALDVPDLMALTTMDGPEKVDLEITYPESRVPKSLADNAMMLLATNIEMLTKRDPISKPVLKPAGEISLSAPRIPVRQRKPVAAKSFDSTDWVDDAQRVKIQTLIQAYWDEHINPLALGISESALHKTRFYEIWGSLLPAAFFADHLNRELPKVDINGRTHKLHFTAEEMVENPTMQTQYDLIIAKLRDSGVLAEPVKKKQNGADDENPILWATPTVNSSGTPLTWRNSIRKLRAHEGRPSVRGLGSKASGWMRHKVSNSLDSGTTIPNSIREVSPSSSERRSLDTIKASRKSILGPYRQAGSPDMKDNNSDDQKPPQRPPPPAAATSSVSLSNATANQIPTRSGSVSSQKPAKANSPAVASPVPSQVPGPMQNPAASSSATSLLGLGLSSLKRSSSAKSKKAMAAKIVPVPPAREQTRNPGSQPPSRPLIPASSPALADTQVSTMPARSTGTAVPALSVKIPGPSVRQPAPAPRRASPGPRSGSRNRGAGIDAPSTNNRILEPIAEPIELASREITRSRYEQLRSDPTDGIITGPDGMIIAELETPIITAGSHSPNMTYTSTLAPGEIVEAPGDETHDTPNASRERRSSFVPTSAFSATGPRGKLASRSTVVGSGTAEGTIEKDVEEEAEPQKQVIKSMLDV